MTAAASMPRAAPSVTAGRTVSRRTVVAVVAGKGLFGRPGPGGRACLYEIRRPTPAAPALTQVPSPTFQVAQQVFTDTTSGNLVIRGVHHVALLCENLERSLAFYQGVLGLDVNPDRPHAKLPYRGAWLWIGAEMIHLMELPNPDPLSGRPEHGGRDRHFCIGVEKIAPLVTSLEAADVAYTLSKSGRPAVFFRDPDMNCLEVVELDAWR